MIDFSMMRTSRVIQMSTRVCTVTRRILDSENGVASMGEVRVDLELENYVDRENASRGLIPPGQVRTARVNALVDSGAGTLILPEEIVETLGLTQRGSVYVTYADERIEERPLAAVVTVRVGNRASELTVVVGHRGSTPLFGQIPLEALDLMIDCRNQRLVPNPASPDIPSMRM